MSSGGGSWKSASATYCKSCFSEEEPSWRSPLGEKGAPRLATLWTAFLGALLCRLSDQGVPTGSGPAVGGSGAGGKVEVGS